MGIEPYKAASPGRKVHRTSRYSRLAMPQGLDQFDRPASLFKEARLELAYGIFAGAVRVLHHAAADAQLAPSIGNGQGPYRDIEARRSIGREPAQRAAIGAARRGFQLMQDFHGANLGRPGDRAAGKQSPQNVRRAAP